MPLWQPKPNQSMATPNDTLLVNFSQIDPVVFPKTCLQAKNTLPTNWMVATTMWMKFTKPKVPSGKIRQHITYNLHGCLMRIAGEKQPRKCPS